MGDSLRIDFFTSDEHYSHTNILKYCDRPFQNRHHMDKVLLENHNMMADFGSTTLHVGDFSFGNDSYNDYLLSTLYGKHVLVKGNHDKVFSRSLGWGFEFVTDKLWLELGGYVCQVSHFPPKGYGTRFENLRPDSGDFVLLHGHTHSKRNVIVNGKDKLINVGVDAWGYKPATLEQISNLVLQLNEDPVCQICRDTEPRAKQKQFIDFNRAMSQVSGLDMGIICDDCLKGMINYEER